jgi:predicted alpha-1,2-mannosidase
LIDPNRQTDIVNALLDIYEHDGYMPDARSGNYNGRTQSGSNCDVLIADAFVKGLKGINYELALKAMLKNADIPPGGNEEKEGRGGLPDYNSLGYVSMNYPRSGSRTVEYAYNDFCIALVAKGLGNEAVFNRFSKQANNWKNLWRTYSNHGANGFIMPREANGKWVDTLVCTVNNKKFMPYHPLVVEKGQCIPWWQSFMYEASSWEYSLYVPQDVGGLINKSGGAVAFKNRLDSFFMNNYYNVGNEPSFLTPVLYHWIGMPNQSAERIKIIIDKKYNETRKGLPGNDDSGAMSSWLAFHTIGLYPNAGQSYYLVHSPLIAQSVIHLNHGVDFKIVAKNFSEKNKYIVSAKLNNQIFDKSWIEHSDILKGGILELEMSDQPSDWGTRNLPPSLRFNE